MEHIAACGERVESCEMSNRHERRKQLAIARKRRDLVRQPSATIQRSELQARVERELDSLTERISTIPPWTCVEVDDDGQARIVRTIDGSTIEPPMLVNPHDYAELQKVR